MQTRFKTDEVSGGGGNYVMAAPSFVLFAKLDQFKGMEKGCREVCGMWGMRNVTQFCKARCHFGDRFRPEVNVMPHHDV